MFKINSGFMLLFLLNFVCPIASKYSSKTAYLDRFTASQLSFIDDVNNYKIENCQAEQIYLFLRHGARTPSSSQVIKSKDFLETYAQYRESSEKTSSVLDEVEATFVDMAYSSLTELGSNEMKSIAARFKSRYGHLFDDVSTIDVLSSHKNRSLDSAHMFIRGLYDTTTAAESLSKRVRFNHSIMRLFDECQKYLIGVRNNKSAAIELTRFENGPEMKQLVLDFIDRHHINDMAFKTSVIRKLFTLCTIETAHRMKSNWCRIFKPDDYEVLGYYNDLKSYWLKSYGHDINSRVALLLYKDLFQSIDDFIHKRNKSFDKKSHYKVLLRFGHAENMIPMLATLGLFRDGQQLRADNFGVNLNRKFRTGLFSPFSANLAFVLHSCGDSQEYKVHVLVNELPVNVIDQGGRLACEQHGSNGRESLCDLERFKAQFESVLKEDHQQVCAMTTANESHSEL